MKPGKLPHEVLADMLQRLPPQDPSVLVGPRVGEDAAVVDLGDRLLICAMDPITFATDSIGRYGVHVNANDVAVMGGTPRWFLATLLLPPYAEAADVGPIFDQIVNACGDLGVTLIGGHTEITIGIDQPVLVGCMLGEAPQEALVTSAGARPGDAIILCGSIAVEGTAILGREAQDVLRSRGIEQDAIDEARGLLLAPGISVVPAALAAAAAKGVSAMHDPTEGGLATGLRELAIASAVGLEVELERVPVLSLTERICKALDLDPMGLIASGSLLVSVDGERAGEVIAALQQAGSEATVIGTALAEDEGLWLLSGGDRIPLPEFPRDEIARFFERKGNAD